METEPEARAVPAPFKALLAGWSLIVVVLAVAGYSFRWTYYYNFGLQGLVLVAPLESLPVYAIEIARNGEFVFDLLRLTILYFLPFHLFMLAIRRARNSQRTRIREGVTIAMRWSGLESNLVVDAIAATIIILIAFKAGGEAGYRNYLMNVVEATSRLPKVTAIFAADSAEAQIRIGCDTRPLQQRGAVTAPPLIGDARLAMSLAAGASCSSDGRSWRLLLRDEQFVYLFASVSNSAQRPQTLVLPGSDKLTLVLQ